MEALYRDELEQAALSREVLYCNECGARLNLYVVGVCSRCHFDLTGEAPDRDAKEARYSLGASEEPGEGTEA